MSLTEDDKWFLEGLLDPAGIEDLPDGAYEQVLIDRIEMCDKFKGRDARSILYAYWKETLP